MKKFFAASAALLVGLSLVPLSTVTAAAAGTANVSCGADVTVRPGELAALLGSGCDPVGATVLLDSGMTLVVPEPGLVVTADAVSPHGASGADGAVYLSESGEVAVAAEHEIVFGTTDQIVAELDTFLHLEHPADEAGSDDSGMSARAVDKCSSAAPNAPGARWASGVYNWEYSTAGAPNSSTAVNRLTAAANALGSGSSSQCGALSNGLTMTYRGTTTREEGVTPTGCGAGDRTNVVGWGDLADSVNWLAVACSWNTIAGFRAESDIRFDNTGRVWWTAAATTGCTGTRWDLQSLAIHEFGHAVGLGHVAQDSNQVMKPYFDPCVMQDRQLGRGDQLGLRALYGS